MALTLSSGKHDLTIDPPIMNAAGFLGFSDEARRLVDLHHLGAIVTSPLSLGPRSPSQGPRVVEFPGGFLLHTGLPGPGLEAVIRRHRRRWATLQGKVIAHLLARGPDEMLRMADILAGIDEVGALEVGLGEVASAEAASLVTAASASLRPVLAHLPLDCSREVALSAVGAGASALVLAPPRGAHRLSDGRTVHGRLYGPALFPLAMRALETWLELRVAPVIGAGGIYTREALEAMIAAGASAVQLDGILWTEPEVVLPFRPRTPTARLDGTVGGGTSDTPDRS
jgi:dihydroorotate dehydrogenase (NAD+) catalytic subunit